MSKNGYSKVGLDPFNEKTLNERLKGFSNRFASAYKDQFIHF